VIGILEMLIVLTVMVYLFGIPIHGSLALLMALSSLFIVCALALGLLVSTLAKTQLEAMQFAFLLMLPTVLLSGFMFPRSEMPFPIYLASFAIPATYFLEILRGIILRGADFSSGGIVRLLRGGARAEPRSIPEAIGLIAASGCEWNTSSHACEELTLLANCESYGQHVSMRYRHAIGWDESNSRVKVI
jgi:hypothetical protein